jgi:uncharacterized FlgJ-related protein
MKTAEIANKLNYMKKLSLLFLAFITLSCAEEKAFRCVTDDHIPLSDYEIIQVSKSFNKSKSKSLGQDEEKTEVFAGRFDNVKGSKYKGIGFPKGRKWLTISEWRGEHIKDKNKKEKFLLWREYYKEQFIYEISKAAIAESMVYKDIPPSLIVAQVILESNYGMSRLAVTANNFFGHKYNGKDKEKFIIAADDSPTDKFTVFKSRWYCMRAHSKLLMRMYHKRVKGKPTVDNWLNALCGGSNLSQSKRWVRKGNYVYATSCYNGSSCYADLLKSIIEKHNLKRLDKIRYERRKAV